VTVSTHVYSAFLIGSPDVELSLRTGSITLDAGAAPHVQATIDIALPAVEVLDELDPRLSARVRLDVEATFPHSTQTRSFDLGLRAREVNHNDAVVTLELASDEGLLGDYAPLVDDTTPRTHEASLRAVVDYVLGEAVAGAALEATPAHDADVTAFWAVTNLVQNPSGETSAANWLAGTGASAFTSAALISPAAISGTKAVRWTAAAGVSNAIAAGSTTEYAVTPGKSYVFTFYLVTGTTGRPTQAVIQWRTQNKVVSQSLGATATSSNTAQTRYHVIATAPEGAQFAYPYIATSSNSAGQFHYADGVMFYEGTELVPYFDGSTPADAGYTYAWSGDAHDSASVRTPVVERTRESLTWAAGQSALDFLHPLVQAAGYRLVCDEQRQWTLRDASYLAPGSLSIRHAVNMIEGSDRIDRDSGAWFDAAVTRYTDPDTQQSWIDSYDLTGGSPTRVALFEKATAYPGPGFSQYAVERAQGRGREVTASCVSDWRANAEQPATIVLEGAPTQTGNTQRVTYDLDVDRMTATLRTTDTPELAWILGPDDLTWDDVSPALTWDAMDEWSDA
jgi:hypothetical protein